MKFFLVGLVALLMAVVGLVPSAGAAERGAEPAKVSALGSGDSWECTADYRSGPHVQVDWDLVDGSSGDWVWQYDISFGSVDNVVFSSHGAWMGFDDAANPLPDFTPEPYWLTSYRSDGTAETYLCTILKNSVGVRPTSDHVVALPSIR